MWISCKVLTTKAYRNIFFHDETFRLQTYILMSWIKIDFFGTRLRSWSFRFFCNLLFASLFIHALWVSTSGILQTSLDIHPKPKISFYDYLPDHNLIWVWIIISTESKESRAPYKEKFWETRLPKIQVVLRRRRWIWDTYPN